MEYQHCSLVYPGARRAYLKGVELQRDENILGPHLSLLVGLPCQEHEETRRILVPSATTQRQNQTGPMDRNPIDQPNCA